MSKDFKRLWGHISARRRQQLILLFVLMVFTSFAEMISIGAVLPFLGVLVAPEEVFQHPLFDKMAVVIDHFETGRTLLLITAIFIIASVVSGGARIALLWAQTRLGFAVGADFSEKIYRNVLYQPYSFHVRQNSSDLIAGISTKTSSVINYCLLPLLFVASSILIVVTIIGVLLYINPKVALISLSGFAVIYSLILLFTRKLVARDSREISVNTNSVLKALQEGLGGIRDVLIDGTQEVFCELYRSADLSLRRSQANIQILGGAPRFLIESFGMVLIALLAYSYVGRPESVANAIPVLGALAVGAQRMLPVLQLMYWSATTIRGHQSVLADVLNLLDKRLPPDGDKPIEKSISFCNSIRVSDLHFRYTPDSAWVLQGLNFELPIGSRIGIIGATGSGKSTLVDIIMGLLEPTRGSLSIDGETVEALNRRAWQAHIAHVPQAIFLKDASIAENIAFGVTREHIDIQRVRQAAERAKIASTIESWRHGYDTVVGERGTRLSGGQRQRIAIARAFYKQADVIIFDEATSALDVATERAIMDAIDNVDVGTTVILVAHRLSTLEKCDTIFELQSGILKVIEERPHN